MTTFTTCPTFSLPANDGNWYDIDLSIDVPANSSVIIKEGKI